MTDYIQQAVEATQAADAAAHASQLAWQLGPDAFMEYMEKKNKEILDRLTGHYPETPTDGDPRPKPDSEATSPDSGNHNNADSHTDGQADG